MNENLDSEHDWITSRWNNKLEGYLWPLYIYEFCTNTPFYLLNVPLRLPVSMCVCVCNVFQDCNF